LSSVVGVEAGRLPSPGPDALVGLDPDVRAVVHHAHADVVHHGRPAGAGNRCAGAGESSGEPATPVSSRTGKAITTDIAVAAPATLAERRPSQNAATMSGRPTSVTRSANPMLDELTGSRSHPGVLP